MKNKVSGIKALEYLEITYELLSFFSKRIWIKSIILKIIFT